jgi:pantoate kinase
MALTPEAKVKANIKKILQLHGVYYAMPMGTGYGNSGVPDFLCCLNGKFLAVEAKANGGIPTALQYKHLDDIQKAGGAAWIVSEDNLVAFEVFVKVNK